LKAFERANNRRYYLHRRLKLRGVFVHAHEGIIELDPEQVDTTKNNKKTIFYLRELTCKFNYSIQYVILKANKYENK